MRKDNTKILKSRFWLMALISFTIVAFTSSYLFGMWMVMPVQVPVERLLNNVGNYIKENPKDFQGYYVLGRVHSLAFAYETNALEINQSDKQPLPGFLPWESIIVKRQAQGPLSEGARRHLVESVRNYRRATELAPDQSMAFLGLGWMLESGARFADQVGSPPGEEKAGKNEAAWKQSALAAYRRAYKLTIKGELGRGGMGPGADASISLEAGQGTIRILEKRKRTNDEEEELSEVRKAVETLQDKPRAVTPIIFPLDRRADLEDLLAKDKLVRFDLAGDGEPGWWPWVKPTTGILVWDPKHSGRVQSGLQLFGSVTWWISWQNGYQPLATIDDNRDGWLEGKELDGLAVWRDRNTNGISEPGEVISAQSAGIVRIAVTASSSLDGVPSNPAGLHLSDGTMLPTYDWTPTEVKHSTVAESR
jgi:hypothetical protein